MPDVAKHVKVCRLEMQPYSSPLRRSGVKNTELLTAVKTSMSAAQARTTATRMRLARTRSAASRALAMLDTKGREQVAPKMTAWAGTSVTSTPSAKTCQG